MPNDDKALGDAKTLLPVEASATESPSAGTPSAGMGKHVRTLAEGPRPSAGEIDARIERIGRYVVVGRLGEGGMGVVLEGYDEELARPVALKVLHEHLGRKHTARLRREAQAMAKLSHPNVVQVYEVGEVEGRTFVAMELIEGQTATVWMRQQPPPDWRTCVKTFLQLGEGLLAAHDKGLVHRDFKPGNAIIDEHGRARVLDFGLARHRERGDDDLPSVTPRSGSDSHPRIPTGESLTKTGAVLGTPAYMPLEQMEGSEVEARSDQFSFCVSLFEALYGMRPFEGDSLAALMLAIRAGEVRRAPKGSPVPARLRAVLLRGLAADPEERWPSMDALLAELRRLVVPRARRWAALGLAIAVVGLGGSWAVGQYVQVKDRCTGAEAKLAGVWDERRKAEVETAILNTELGYAPSTWERVRQRLDAYANSWTVEHTGVCEATAVRREQSEEVMDLRMGCMEKRRVALRAAVDVLADADATVVKNAVQLVASLPGSSRCDDVDALRAQVPPPEDPVVTEEVEALRGRLAKLRAEESAGRYGSALEEVEPVVQQAEALGYAPLVAEARLRRGMLRARNGEYNEAEQDVREAYALAIEHRHDEVALRAAQELTFTVGPGQARFAEAAVWGEAAVAHAKRAGDDVALAVSLHNVGSVLSAQGELEQAKAQLERVLQMRQRTLGASHLHVSLGLNDLGAVLFKQGKYEQAQHHWERALRIREELLGSDHPLVALSLNNLGIVLSEQGKHAQAKQHFERGLRTKEKALGADHPSVGASLGNLGSLLLAQGEYEQAQRHQERALRIHEKAFGAEHPEVARSLHNLGAVLMARGEHEQAQRHCERALRIDESVFGPDHAEVALALNALGTVLVGRGEHEQAQRHYARALRVSENVFGVDDPRVTEPLVGLARVAMAMADVDAARKHAERAVSILERVEGAPPWLAEARFELARALWPDHSERARELARRARDALAELGPGPAVELADIERWLAAHPAQ